MKESPKIKHVFKSSGAMQLFSAKKLKRSIQRAGLGPNESREITKEISNKIKPGVKTKDIFNNTFKLIQKKSPIAAIHYSLKKSLLELGPTGFEFEYFVSKYFQEIGFATEIGKIIQGEFVGHEVDIVASKQNYQTYVECKFHNNAGRSNDIKVALYVKARWDDLKNGLNGKTLKDYFIVTNTTFSTDAVAYARGTGLMLLGVNAPADESFLDKIKKLKLYPITSLIRLKKIYRQELLINKIILCKDLLGSRKFLLNLGLNEEYIDEIFEDIIKLIQ